MTKFNDEFLRNMRINEQHPFLNVQRGDSLRVMYMAQGKLGLSVEVMTMKPGDVNGAWFNVSSIKQAENILFEHLLSLDPVTEQFEYQFGIHEAPLQVHTIINQGNDIAKRSKRGAANILVASETTYLNLFPKNGKIIPYFSEPEMIGDHIYIGSVANMKFIVSNNLPLNTVIQLYKGVNSMNVDGAAFILEDLDHRLYLCIPTIFDYNGRVHYKNYINVLRFKSHVVEWLEHHGFSLDYTQWTNEQKVHYKLKWNDLNE